MLSRLAKELNYKFVFLGNNDIILPNGAIKAMRKVLAHGVSVVVPLTSKKGAGHNPSQSLVKAHNLSSTLESFISNPYNVHSIQKSLTLNAFKGIVVLLSFILSLTV